MITYFLKFKYEGQLYSKYVKVHPGLRSHIDLKDLYCDWVASILPYKVSSDFLTKNQIFGSNYGWK